MAKLPSGTVTFLFTDIEGSTKLWQKHPEEMKEALQRHHSLLEQSITSHNGYVFQIIGDAFCAAFASALDGLEAALDAQKHLATEQWGETGPIKVRMALHTGEAEARIGDYTSGEYASGLTLSRAARLLSAGHGGQVLLSSATAGLVKDRLPRSISLRDMGSRRLKDLVQPEQIFQVLAQDLPQDFPPLKTLDSKPNNLPAQLTNFIGREQELKKIKELVTQNRLVSLTGPGGIGKTRLSLQTGAELLDVFEQGVWFVELVSLTDESLIAQTMAAILKVHEEPGCTPLDSLVQFIRDKKMLIILDNCEHLGQATSLLARQLLQAAPGLKILVSSLERLRLSGEVVYPVKPLSVPDLHAVSSLRDLPLYDSVQVFIDRAVAANPSFHLTEKNAPAVAGICSRLDGIPLALELAAARLRTLPVEKIAERINDRFRILTSGDQTSVPHHQTLRALVDWSYELLGSCEQLMLQRLSVFSGGWTLEAAEEICSGGEVDTLDVMDLLGNLVEKSLVILEVEENRYKMLETIRLYSLEKLKANGETQDYHQKHSLYFLQLAEKESPKLNGAERSRLLHLLAPDQDNMRAAFEWFTANGESEAALRFVIAFGLILEAMGELTEGRLRLNQALILGTGAKKELLAEAYRLAGGMAWQQRDYPAARKFYLDSFELSTELDNKTGIAISLNGLGLIENELGNYEEARSKFVECISIYNLTGNKTGISVVQNNLGNVSISLKEYPEALKYYRSVLEFFKEAGHTGLMAAALVNMGLVEKLQGNFGEAKAYCTQSLEICRKAGHRGVLAESLSQLGDLASIDEDFEMARNYKEESLQLHYQLGDKRGMAYALSGISQALCRPGQETATSGNTPAMIQSATLQGSVMALLKAVGVQLDPFDQAVYDRTAAILRKSLGEVTYRQAFETGRSMALEKVLDLAKDR